MVFFLETQPNAFNSQNLRMSNQKSIYNLQTYVFQDALSTKYDKNMSARQKHTYQITFKHNAVLLKFIANFMKKGHKLKALSLTSASYALFLQSLIRNKNVVDKQHFFFFLTGGFVYENNLWKNLNTALTQYCKHNYFRFFWKLFKIFRINKKTKLTHKYKIFFVNLHQRQRRRITLKQITQFLLQQNICSLKYKLFFMWQTIFSNMHTNLFLTFKKKLYARVLTELTLNGFSTFLFLE